MMLDNVRTFLTETQRTSVSFINTFNLLSLPSLRQYLQMILELRAEFGGRAQPDYRTEPTGKDGVIHTPYKNPKFQRVWFDIPILRYPPWLSIQNAGQQGIDIVTECIAYMEENVQQDDYLETFEGFKPYEILKVKRDLAIMQQPLSSDSLARNKRMFYQFIAEYDSRKGRSFIDSFPEMKEYYVECMKASVKGS